MMTTMEGNEGDLILTKKSLFKLLSEFLEPSEEYVSPRIECY